MSKYFIYILFSNSNNKFYVGSTNNLQRRLTEHNSGRSKSTKSGLPWELIYFKECNSKSEAYQFEMKIKNRGISRYLDDKQKSR